MSTLSTLPQILMSYLQKQNVKREIAKKIYEVLRSAGKRIAWESVSCQISRIEKCLSFRDDDLSLNFVF